MREYSKTFRTFYVNYNNQQSNNPFINVNACDRVAPYIRAKGSFIKRITEKKNMHMIIIIIIIIIIITIIIIIIIIIIFIAPYPKALRRFTIKVLKY